MQDGPSPEYSPSIFGEYSRIGSNFSLENATVAGVHQSVQLHVVHSRVSNGLRLMLIFG